jgi:hypothetical protein
LAQSRLKHPNTFFYFFIFTKKGLTVEINLLAS